MLPMVTFIATNQTATVYEIGGYRFPAMATEPTVADLSGTDLEDARVLDFTITEPAEPVNTVAPIISGTAAEDEELTGTDGTWTGAPDPAFTYQWQRSADGETGWSDIADADSDTYTLVAADVGNYVRLAVTGTNSEGSDTAYSEASEQVTGA